MGWLLNIDIVKVLVGKINKKKDASNEKFTRTLSNNQTNLKRLFIFHKLLFYLPHIVFNSSWLFITIVTPSLIIDKGKT